MPSFTQDQVTFYYEEMGSGLPFIFQHGLGADLSQCFGLFRPPPGVRLIAFDCRGHGRTAPFGDPEKIGLASFADDLKALMEFLEVPRAVLGGISMGAAVALNFALRFPAAVLGLVLSRPAWLDGPNPWNVRMFSLVARLLQDHGPTVGLELFRQTPDFLETARDYPDVARSLCNQFDNPRARENLINLERIPRDAPSVDRHDWKTIGVPTLILANRHDPIHPFEYGEAMAELIPGAEFHEITSKSVDLEQHGRDVQRRIGDFLSRGFLSHASL